MSRTKPEVKPTSTLSKETGAQIANYVRDDVIAVLLDALSTLIARGCSNIEMQIWNGLNISRLGNHYKSYERGVIPVGGISADHHRHRPDGSHSLSEYAYWYAEADLVGLHWERIDEVLGADPRVCETGEGQPCRSIRQRFRHRDVSNQ